eukprot:CAMPEP_0206232844 /NCGR_PEP_ID=MMETSP0047_2-20121206/11642_1 /ASSEMBLY_ACC=CAM_ASM_000192 /TAXON_ID=195065 /ORGANISM="Chroomonas mesostigmatica_cf, Strain CCMP1168" /LENGTH=103 /DNA_ID=CAMNT_0053656627 /DNA_START=48 /DNA_END=359 /DNA_ORIENTATION=-
MAGRVAAVAGILGVGGAAYYMFSAKPAEAKSSMTAEQKKSAMLRSRLSGHHPSVSGGQDCHSKSSQTGVSLKHLDSGKSTKGSDSHDGKGDARSVSGGTVIVK